MIDAKIVADSVNPDGNRITTFVATYPRWIHCELLTHRLFSRNSASSRAIPVERVMEMVRSNPAMPVHWGKAQKGMKAEEEISDEDKKWAKQFWLSAAESAVQHARRLLKHGVHKQVANRVLEPFVHMTTIITATEWGNFFNLRASPEAQPEFQELAYLMLEKYQASEPAKKVWGEWHLPFSNKYLPEKLTTEKLVKITTARSARVSYMNFAGDIDHDDDYRLHDQLMKEPHASPFEHSAFADPEPKSNTVWFTHPWTKELHPIKVYRNNFQGWLPYRKLVPNEHREAFDPQEILARRKHES